jgi:Spy/CpxP family protein refolding chaperone
MRIPLALVVLAALAASPVAAQAPETALKPAAIGPAKPKPARRSTLIDINFATKEQLETLPDRACKSRGHHERSPLQREGRIPEE